MKFKDTEYGDLTGKVYDGTITLNNVGLTSLEGAPKEVTGAFCVPNNKLKSLEHCPTKIRGALWCEGNLIGPEDFKREIVKYKILASNYINGDEDSTFYKETALELMKMDKRVSRPSMRTLLGLDK